MPADWTHLLIFLQREGLSCTSSGAEGRSLPVVTVTFKDQLLWSQSNLKHACLQQHVPLQCRSCHDNLFCKHLSYPIKCLTVTARKGFPQKKKKKSCLLLVSPLCPRTSLPVPCFMLHVHVVSSCFSDSPGSRLNLNFICKQFRPPTHDYICNNGGCVLHGWLLLCCRCCFACCTDQICCY